MVENPKSVVGENRDLLTTVEAAHYLGVSRPTVNSLKRSGKIEATPLGWSKDGFRRSDLDELLRQNPQLPTRAAPALDATTESSTLVTLDEAATQLGVSRSTFNKLRTMAGIAAVGRNRTARYRQSDVERLMQLRDGTSASGRLCACGCTESLSPLVQGRFLAGHQSKLTDNGALRGPAVKKRYPTPPTVLGRFLRDKWQASGQNLRTFSNSIAFEHSQIKSYIRGVRPQDRVIVRLQAAFEDFPEVESYSDILRERGRKNLGNGAYQATRTPEALAKMAMTQRGRVVSAATRAKAQKTRETSMAWAEHMANTSALNQSIKNRATRSLSLRLKHEPQPEMATVHQWAADAAARLDIPSPTVLVLWRPSLVKRGLLRAGGRPPNTRRCQIIADELARLPKSRQKRVPNDFWPHIATLVSAAEGIAESPLDAMGLKVWRTRHRYHDGCPLPQKGANR